MVPSHLEHSSATSSPLRRAEHVRIGRDLRENPLVRVGKLRAEPRPNLTAEVQWGDHHHVSREAWISILVCVILAEQLWGKPLHRHHPEFLRLQKVDRFLNDFKKKGTSYGCEQR